MAPLITNQEYQQVIRQVRGSAGSRPMFFHTDLERVGFIDSMKPRHEVMLDYLNPIVEECEDVSIGFPTFSYACLRTGIYDVAADRSEVGVLNEHFRVNGADVRTRTPVFNYCLRHPGAFATDACENPFGVESIFGIMTSSRSTIIFLGAPLDSNTFVHHVEEMTGIGYRYPKEFPVRIVDGSSTQEVSLSYRVRPRDPRLVQYDWDRLRSDLEEVGILSSATLGGAEVLWFDAADLFDYFVRRVRDDEFYLLHPGARAACSDAARIFGYPFTIDQLEP